MNTLSINTYNTQTFTHSHTNSDLSQKKKAVILASSAAGMTPVLAVLAKRKGFSLNPIKILKTPIKNWAIFKYAPKEKVVKYEDPAVILALASGSVAGGFLGGCLVDDKHNRKAKQREVLSQMLGNILVPVGCVGLGAKVYGKYADKIEGVMPQFKNTSKFFKVVNKCLTKLPNAIGTIAFLSVGIYCGNKVSNFINDKLYNKKVQRDIKATDFAPHVDDVCMAVSMMNKDSTFGSKLGRIIPFALLVPGYQTGIAQRNSIDVIK